MASNIVITGSGEARFGNPCMFEPLVTIYIYINVLVCCCHSHVCIPYNTHIYDSYLNRLKYIISLGIQITYPYCLPPSSNVVNNITLTYTSLKQIVHSYQDKFRCKTANENIDMIINSSAKGETDQRLTRHVKMVLN